MLRKVFVYGTLKRGMSNAGYIPDYVIETMCEATTKGKLYYVNGGTYPCLKLKGDNTIYGELYSIKEKCWPIILKQMDELEGCPVLYERKKIYVNTPNGKEECWAYIFKMDKFLGDEIQSGKFLGRQQKKNYTTYIF